MNFYINYQIQDNFQEEIGSFVSQNEYELINASEANGLVYDVIEEHYNDTGRILDMKEAADAVDNASVSITSM